MKLKKLLTGQQEAGRVQLIGREIEILDERALLLGLMETEEMGEYGPEKVTKLMMLYEEKEIEEDWDEEEWDDEETWSENQTRRQVLIEWMEESSQQSITDIEAFLINGIRYEAEEVSDINMDERPYDEVLLMKSLAEEDSIPGYWMEMDLNLLGLAEYEVDAEMFNVNWDADILSVSAELIQIEEDVLVGKVLECNIGRYKTPMEFEIKGRGGESLSVKIHGVYLDNIWEDAQCLDFDFSELEEICRRDERLLVLDYSVQSSGLQLNFFTKERLDAQIYSEEVFDDIYDIPVAEKAIQDETLGASVGRCVLDVVSEDFDADTVEVELLSYTELED